MRTSRLSALALIALFVLTPVAQSAGPVAPAVHPPRGREGLVCVNTSTSPPSVGVFVECGTQPTGVRIGPNGVTLCLPRLGCQHNAISFYLPHDPRDHLPPPLP